MHLSPGNVEPAPAWPLSVVGRRVSNLFVRCTRLGDERGRGVGRLLMEQAESWARDRGCGAVCVRSNVARERAPYFYEGIGDEQIKTSRVFLKELEGRR